MRTDGNIVVEVEMGRLYRGICLFLFVLVLSGQAWATPAVIVDNYIGGTPTSSSWVGKDIVGSAKYFDVREVWANITPENTLEISIVSSYFDNVGKYGTGIGDFFISVDGYNPVADTTLDTAYTGEDWEYAVVFSEHGENYMGNNETWNAIGEEGTVGLYDTNDGTIQNSFANGTYRADQEVLFNANRGPITTGTFAIAALDEIYSTLSFSLALDNTPLADIESFAFHWGMTCGNDVIEGEYFRDSDVPEPATCALLGAALVGIRRKKFSA